MLRASCSPIIAGPGIARLAPTPSHHSSAPGAASTGEARVQVAAAATGATEGIG